MSLAATLPRWKLLLRSICPILSVPSQGKLYTEDMLEKRGVNWTSVRPVYIYGQCRRWHELTASAAPLCRALARACTLNVQLQCLTVCLHCLRFFCLAGPLNYNPVEEFFFHRIKAGRPICVPGSGQQVTQLGHVKDLADAFVKILGNPKAARQVYNVAGER